MSLPNTTNVSPLYISRRPDWSREVAVTMAHSTTVFDGRNGLEQRQRSRARARWRMSYTETGLDVATFMLRWRRAAAEAVAPCWVPFWTEGFTISVKAGAVITLSGLPVPGMWEPGQKVFAESQFLTIVARAGQIVTLSATPVAGVGARAYPVRLCRRIVGSDSFSQALPRRHVEEFEFETIE